MYSADNAYMAGILDGEGSISMTRVTGKRNGRPAPWWRVTVSVSSCDRVLIEWIQARWKGVTMWDMDRGPTRRLQHRWVATAGDAGAVLRDCLPYFVIKGERATKALEVRRIQTSERAGYGQHYGEEQRARLAELREWFDNEKRSRSAAARGQEIE